MKIEFGRLAGGENQGQLVIADVIDNDAWRIWPQGREELMLDKQMYRNLSTVDEAALEDVKRAYERVADFAGSFPVMRPGMVAVIADAPARVERANEIAKAIGQIGLPSVRHVANPAVTPGFVLQLLAQLEASFGRLAIVAVGDDALLHDMINASSPAPVFDGRGDVSALVLPVRRSSVLKTPCSTDVRCSCRPTRAPASCTPMHRCSNKCRPRKRQRLVNLRDDELSRIAQRLDREPTR